MKKIGLVQAIADIPMALKGFPKNLIKDPKSAAEMEQWRRISNAYLWIAAIPLIVAVVLMVLQLGGSVSPILALAGFGAMIFLAYRKNSVKNTVGVQIESLTCPECQSMIAYDNNVHYDVLDVQVSVHSTKTPTKRGEEAKTSPMHINATGEETTRVKIYSKCQNCGNEHTFTQAFCTGRCSKSIRDVAYYQADTVKLQLDNEVRQVAKDVFTNGKADSNAFGVAAGVC